MGYHTVTVVVEGAIDDERDFSDSGDESSFMAEVARAAAADGLHTEVFVIEHPHDHDLDEWGQEQCECAQYAQDHRPVRTFND